MCMITATDGLHDYCEHAKIKCHQARLLSNYIGCKKNKCQHIQTYSKRNVIVKRFLKIEQGD